MKVTRRSLLAGAAAAGAAAVLGPAKARARERKVAGPDDVGMLFDSTRCVGCRACMSACREANVLPPEVAHIDGGVYDAPADLSGSTKTVIKLYTDGQHSAFLKAQCNHCIDPACVSVCMAGALHKAPNGVVVYDKSVCVGCRYCQVACPYDVPKFQWHEAVPVIVKCEMCAHRKEGPACAGVCPRGAIVKGLLADLKTEAHRRQAAEPGRYLDKVYGEQDGGGTHVLYLTSPAVPFGKLGLPDLPTEPLPEMSERIQHTIYKGFIAPGVLYGLFTIVQFRNRKRGGHDGAHDSAEKETP